MRRLMGMVLAAATALAEFITLTGCATVVEMPRDAAATTAAEQQATGVRPQDDYYRYINEEYLKTVEFEYGQQSAGASFDQDMIADRIKGIVTDVVSGSVYERGSEEDIVKRAYELCRDYDYDNTPVPADLEELVGEIINAGNVQELMDIDARLYRDYGVSGFLRLSVDANYLEPGRNDLCFRNISSMITCEFKDLQDSYSGLTSVKNMAGSAMQYAGRSKAEADEAGTKLGYIVFDIYNATDMDIVNDSLPLEYFFELTRDEAEAIFTNVDLDRYITNMGVDSAKCDRFTALDLRQLECLNSVFTEDNLEALKAWKLADLINRYGEFITPHSDILIQYYNKDYRDAEVRAMDTVIEVFCDETDPLYVEQYYTDEMDVYLRNMCDDIREGYRALITDAKWLTEGTRQSLLTKLDNIIYVTAKDLERHDNSKYSTLSGNNYYEFLHNYRMIKSRERLDMVGEVSPRTATTMPMQMFNACYNPSTNSITVTAAMMNAPFYDKDADYYTNLGGIGFTIAHEMGHAFDSNCILFNSEGRYDPSWIDAGDVEALEQRNDTAISYFEDNFTVFGVYHINGTNTLGENYADLGGMECIASLAGTDEQREKMFTNFAVTWREKQLDTAVMDQLQSDEHSPAVIRVNAILSTLDEFYDTYGVTEGDGMYIEPGSRISRWH